MKKCLLVIGAAIVLAAPGSAEAQFTGQTCQASDLFSVTVTGCYGFVSGNLNSGNPGGQTTRDNALAFLLGGSPVAAISEQQSFIDGTNVLNFTTTLYGLSVVGIHWGNGNAYTGNSTAWYKFDAGVAGINSITLGPTPAALNLPYDMSHAISNGAIYSTDVLTVGQLSVVPEPSTYALMAAGLAALGVVARRRRNA